MSILSEQLESKPWFLRNTRLRGFLENDGVSLVLVLLWGVFVCYHNLSNPVETDEALYAAVGRRIARTGEWFRLEHEGSPFLYKPPLHFWLMALSISWWGESEFAVRFASATFGLATMLLTYYAGKLLFNRRAGLIGALVTATTFLAVWLARKAKMDIELGFLMNLAFLAFYLAYRKDHPRLGFLVLAFLSATIATMHKGPVGILLPGFAAFAYLAFARGSKMFRELPLLAGFLTMSICIIAVYYWSLGAEFNRYFFMVENLHRIVESSKPFLFYYYMIFVQFFPWSFFLPCIAVFLYASTWSNINEAEWVAPLWFVAFLLFLTIPSYKEQDFLVYLVPSFCLMTGRYWDRFLTLGCRGLPAAENRLLRTTLVLLSLAIVGVMTLGPTLIQMRFPNFPLFLPPPFILLLLAFAISLMYAAWRQHTKMIFLGVVAVAMAVTFGVVQFFDPARGHYNSVKTIAEELRLTVGDSPLVMSFTQGSTELLYYLDRKEPVRYVGSPEVASAVFRAEPHTFGLLAEDLYEQLQERNEVALTRLADYSHRKWHYVLVKQR